MIVNDDVVVDKKSFLHKISSLRRRELTGQGLYPASIDIGEKTACRSRRRFCTSDPVHIQRLVHSRAAFRPLFSGKTGGSSVSATWQGTFGAALQCRQLAPGGCDSSLAAIAIGFGISFRPVSTARTKPGQTGPARFRQAPTNACSAVVFSAVDSERVFATFCQTFLQQRTRRRLQHRRRFFLLFPALAHFIFLISR